MPFGSSCSGQIQLRNCRDGVLSGTYAFENCKTAPAANCNLNGETISHGASITAYSVASVPHGNLCSSVTQTRTCTNGTLSGNYAYINCYTAPPKNCSFNGATVADGASVTAYSVSIVPYGTSCATRFESRKCTGGVLSGTFAFTRCDIAASGPNCTFNGTTVNHGASVTAYAASSVAFGSTCTSQTRTCTNGALSGTYDFGSCNTNCTFNGTTVAHGASVTAYAASSVAFGSTCTSQTRTCTNGALSGTYDFGSCNTNCTFNGTTVAHGASVTAYATSSVASGNACTPQTRTCTNGALSGTYGFSSCNVTSATTTTTTTNASPNSLSIGPAIQLLLLDE